MPRSRQNGSSQIRITISSVVRARLESEVALRQFGSDIATIAAYVFAKGWDSLIKDGIIPATPVAMPVLPVIQDDDDGAGEASG